jgi:predicted nucleic acid-binding protein
VAAGLILETTFLVDLEREAAAGSEGPAQRFLMDRSAEPVFLTFTILGELAAGLAPEDRAGWEQLVAPFPVLPFTSEVAWEYGKAYRHLQRNGLLIGANDLWIAATAIAFDTTLVTRNARDYRRVPALRLLGY